jgi:hypothetical protein
LTVIMALQALLGLAFQSAYRDAAWIKAAWFGNDWVTLAVAVPALAFSMALTRRGSTRGSLLGIGIAAYGVYNYAYYLLGAALNAFFPGYVLAFVLSIATLMAALSRFDLQLVAAISPRSPSVRVIGGFFVFVGSGLSAAWLAMWAMHVFAAKPTPIAPEAFRLVAALDMAILVPPLLFGGILLSKFRPWGVVISAAAGVQSSSYLIVLTVNSAVAVHRGFAEASRELPIWGTLAFLTAAMTLWLFHCCAPRAPADQTSNPLSGREP